MMTRPVDDLARSIPLDAPNPAELVLRVLECAAVYGDPYGI